MSANADAYLEREGTLFPTPKAEAKAAAWEKHNEDDYLHGYQQAGGAEAAVTAGSYVGVDAGVTAYKYGHDNGEIKLGLGLDTGVGIRNKSVEIKVLGCGLSLGNETGFSFFGSSVKAKSVFTWWS